MRKEARLASQHDLPLYSAIVHAPRPRPSELTAVAYRSRSRWAGPRSDRASGLDESTDEWVSLLASLFSPSASASGYTRTTGAPVSPSTLTTSTSSRTTQGLIADASFPTYAPLELIPTLITDCTAGSSRTSATSDAKPKPRQPRPPHAAARYPVRRQTLRVTAHKRPAACLLGLACTAGQRHQLRVRLFHDASGILGSHSGHATRGRPPDRVDLRDSGRALLLGIACLSTRFRPSSYSAPPSNQRDLGRALSARRRTSIYDSDLYLHAIHLFAHTATHTRALSSCRRGPSSLHSETVPWETCRADAASTPTRAAPHNTASSSLPLPVAGRSSSHGGCETIV